MWKYTTKGALKVEETGYPVEHLATFRIGPQFGVQWPEDGVKKLREMERTSDVWAQKLILKFNREFLVLEDENGEIVEKFPKNLVGEPHDYPPNIIGGGGGGGSITSNDDNLLIFNVNEQAIGSSATKSAHNAAILSENFPAEMHIFRCTKEPASEVASAVKRFLSGNSSAQIPPPLRSDNITSTGQSSRVIPVQVESSRLRGPTQSARQWGPAGNRQFTSSSSSHHSRRHHHHQHSRSAADTNNVHDRFGAGPPAGGPAPPPPAASGGGTLGRRALHRTAAGNVVEDFSYGGGQYGRRGPTSAEPVLIGRSRTIDEAARGGADFFGTANRMARSYSEYPIGSAFDSDVNTLNCYIDDVERFVSRVQSVGTAQQELDNLRQREAAAMHQLRVQQQRQMQQQQRRGAGGVYPPEPPPPTFVPDANMAVLQNRAQWPTEAEFVDILTKFKYCFNILGKIQDQIYDPDAPQLARYLFTPLLVVLDSARWALNKDLAPQITYPALTPEANLLLQQNLSQREYEIWLSLGDSWRLAPEPFTSRTTLSRRPVNNVAYPAATAYRTTIEQHGGGRTLPHGFSTSDIDRLRSQEEIEYEARQLAEKERILREKEAMLEKMEQKLNYDRESLRDNFERVSLVDGGRHQPTQQFQQPRGVIVEPAPPPPGPGPIGPFGSSTGDPSGSSSRAAANTAYYRSHSSQRAGIDVGRGVAAENGIGSSTTLFQKQKSNFEKLKRQGAGKIAYVTHDRTGRNEKELTVSKGDYVEILNDSRNWWQCRDANNVIGFVPHTILSLMPLNYSNQENIPSGSSRQQHQMPPGIVPPDDAMSRLQKPISVTVPPHSDTSTSYNQHYYPREHQTTNGRPGPTGYADRTIIHQRNGRF